MKHTAIITIGLLISAISPQNASLSNGIKMPGALAQDTAQKPSDKKESPKPELSKSDRLESLFGDLARQARTAPANSTARLIWKEWSDSGSDSINALMQWAGIAMNDKKHAQALDLLDQVTVLMPNYSEGWNRRATLYFTMKKFGKSIADIEQTLRLEPRHFGALSGLGMILQQTKQDEKALETWYKVLEIYPANKAAQDAVIALEEKLADRRT